MERKVGYYWVKVKSENPNPNWSAVHWIGDNWVYHGNLMKVPESMWLLEINEIRIPSPDEVIVHNQIPPDFFKEQEDEIREHAKNAPPPKLMFMVPENPSFSEITAHLGFNIDNWKETDKELNK